MSSSDSGTEKAIQVLFRRRKKPAKHVPSTSKSGKGGRNLLHQALSTPSLGRQTTAALTKKSVIWGDSDSDDDYISASNQPVVGGGGGGGGGGGSGDPDDPINEHKYDGDGGGGNAPPSGGGAKSEIDEISKFLEQKYGGDRAEIERALKDLEQKYGPGDKDLSAEDMAKLNKDLENLKKRLEKYQSDKSEGKKKIDDPFKARPAHSSSSHQAAAASSSSAAPSSASRGVSPESGKAPLAKAAEALADRLEAADELEQDLGAGGETADHAAQDIGLAVETIVNAAVEKGLVHPLKRHITARLVTKKAIELKTPPRGKAAQKGVSTRSKKAVAQALLQAFEQSGRTPPVSRSGTARGRSGASRGSAASK